MSSKNARSFTKTVTFRLTLWYLVLLCVLLAVIFAVVQWRLTATLEQRLDSKIIVKMSRSPLFEEGFFMRPLLSLETSREFFYWDSVVEGPDQVFWLLLRAPEVLEETQWRTLASSDLSHWGQLAFDDQAIPFLRAMVDVADTQLPPIQGDIRYARTIEVSPTRPLALTTLPVPGTDHGVRMGFLGLPDFDLVMAMGISLGEDERLVAGYRRVFAIAFCVVLTVAGFLGFLLTHHAMAGVKRVTQTAAAIEHGDLTQRVVSKDEGQEIHDLTEQFNRMLERIAGVVTELKDVTNNVAHDLRSPITHIRGLVETTLMSRPSIEDYAVMSGAVIEESDHLIGMINTMLTIARTDSGIVQLERKPVDLDELLDMAHDLFVPVAEDSGIHFDLEVPEDHIFVLGDCQSLQRIVANLVDNALKFTPAGGTVCLSSEVAAREVTIRVDDSGTGISAEELPRIFDRFYRTDQSRTEPGSGLGLSLVQAFVRAHEGTVSVESELGKGSTFTVTLPRAFPGDQDGSVPHV
jgi:signal transduction histidine kinase